MPSKWRWTFGLRKGQWHPTKREAQDAAIREKLASREEWSDRLYPIKGLRIEERP